jgi:hypothetical protein
LRPAPELDANPWRIDLVVEHLGKLQRQIMISEDGRGGLPAD